MVIVDSEIAQRVERNGLIDSYDKTCLTNFGYDLRAKKFYVASDGKDSVTLKPNESAFVESVEVISIPKDLLGIVTLKNSRIRQGLSLESPIYQPGHKTRIYFRLTNVSADSIVLECGEKYGTILFEELSKVPDHPYTGAFSDEFSFSGLGDYKDVYKHQIRELEKKADDVKAIEHSIYGNVLVILSVFVAMFSFLTANISLVANAASIRDYFIFNSLLLGCISFFAALLGMIIRGTKKAFWYWIPAIICFVAAFVLFLW